METQLNTKLLVNNLATYTAPFQGQGSAVAKSLNTGSGYQDPALSSWLEQATAYYNAVLAGDPNTPKPDQQAWNDLMMQMDWAKQQLGYGQQAWDPMAGQNGGFPQGGGQQNPGSGKQGPMGNTVWNSPEGAQITDSGTGQTHDVWGDLDLYVDSVSAEVTYEITTDTRTSPPEEVLKIIVRDPATGTENVYFHHNADESQLRIHTLNEEQISAVGTVNGDIDIAWKEFNSENEEARPDASVPGEEQADGSILYAPEYSDPNFTVDFWANPGENQVHVIPMGHANISVKPTDTVTVQNQGDEVIVVVTHADGSTDTYQVTDSVNINSEEVTFLNVNGFPYPGEGIPEKFRDKVTLNGGADPEGEKGSGVVDELLAQTGTSDKPRTEEQLLSALKAAGFSEYDTIEELQEAISKGEFPGEANANLLEFLFTLDEDLAGFRVELQEAQENGEGIAEVLTKIRDRIATLLQTLYPDSIVSPGSSPGYIMINGETFAWSFGEPNDFWFEPISGDTETEEE